MEACVICALHGMDGLDFHDSYPTFPPTLATPPIPWGPHLVTARLILASKQNVTVLTPHGPILSRGFDIGWGILHIPLCANTLWWLWSIFSSSVGHFGVSSVEAPEGAIAAASHFVTNVQLDCGGPVLSPPTPSALVFAPNTVIAGMTEGDVKAGWFTMVTTGLVQWGLSIVFNHVGDIVTKSLLRGTIPVDPKFIELFKSTIKKHPLLTKFLDELGGNLVQGAIANIIGGQIEKDAADIQQETDHGPPKDDYFDSPDLPPPFPRLPGSVPMPILIL